MSELVAAFGSSHSPMLAACSEDWQAGFLARDKARQFVDCDGNACAIHPTSLRQRAAWHWARRCGVPLRPCRAKRGWA
jgi:hypothetical protein